MMISEEQTRQEVQGPRRWDRTALFSLLLRAGRITKYYPGWRGVNSLRRFYQKHMPEGHLLRIRDLDGDLTVDIDLREEIGLFLWHYPRRFEKEERELFCSYITPGCTVLDVGANIGFYTLLAAKRGARVFAVEADPMNAAKLRHHVSINGFTDRVTVFELAATDCDREVALYRRPFNQGASNVINNGRPSGYVEGKPLDSLGLPPIDVCKMDIEGSESMALKGMAKLLSQSPQIKLFVEYAEVFGNGKALLELLHANFSTVQVLEPQDQPDKIPSFCNLLALR